MTLLEMLFAIGIGSLVLAVVLVLVLFAARSFIALGNYAALDQQSRLGADVITREIREATAVVAWQKTATARSLTLTNALEGYGVRYTWDASSRNLVVRRSDAPADRVLLAGCDLWDFQLWQRTPQPGPTNAFFPALTPAQSKIVDMSWKCSRTVGLTALLNTETVQTAQIVLRNQRSN